MGTFAARQTFPIANASQTACLSALLKAEAAAYTETRIVAAPGVATDENVGKELFENV